MVLATAAVLEDVKAVNRYRLTVSDLTSVLTVLAIRSQQMLNQPWCYEVVFTSANKSIKPEAMLSQRAALSFHSPLDTLNTLNTPESAYQPESVYGVITSFTQIASNQDEARYRVVLSPRLALLEQHHNSAIYQNQSVIEVVQSVLRQHGFTGIDYRLELKENYPRREFISQWQESDLAFIQRLLADVGVWMRFESHAKHHCDVLVISDNEQGINDAGTVVYQLPSGMIDAQAQSVWDLQLHSQIVPQSVLVQDYNYRQADTDMQHQVNEQSQARSLHGRDYRYGEHYQNQGDENSVESGAWYAKIRQQQHLSRQVIIHGKTNLHTLAPGQKLQLSQHPLAQQLSNGVLILSVQAEGSRSQSYQATFSAIPFEILKPYRPPIIAWPQVTGTVPARITSPEQDIYGYIDTNGRYRVKFNFDLKAWPNGNESLWLRLAKPYAGNTYGLHFPLIDGTEVAIAFSNADPDRPYIAYALHDSANMDLVSTANRHRNLIRTAANNELQLDDKRGQEHIKLATEYATTQLNLGHLVNQNFKQRGQGFELRTDDWGALAAEKGLYLSTQTTPKAQDEQLDMPGAINQLEQALAIAKALQDAVKHSQAHEADLPSQQQLTETLTQLKQSGIVGYAQHGIGLLSPQNIQLSSSNNVTVTARAQTDISSIKKITLAAGEALSLFAHKIGIKLFASKGKVAIQAQNDALEMAAKHNVKLDSAAGSTSITAATDLTLNCGGSYLKLHAGGIEFGSAGNVLMFAAISQKLGPSSIPPEPPILPGLLSQPTEKVCLPCLIQAAEKGQMIVKLGAE